MPSIILVFQKNTEESLTGSHTVAAIIRFRSPTPKSILSYAASLSPDTIVRPELVSAAEEISTQTCLTLPAWLRCLLSVHRLDGQPEVGKVSESIGGAPFCSHSACPQLQHLRSRSRQDAWFHWQVCSHSPGCAFWT